MKHVEINTVIDRVQFLFDDSGLGKELGEFRAAGDGGVRFVEGIDDRLASGRHSQISVGVGTLNDADEWDCKFGLQLCDGGSVRKCPGDEYDVKCKFFS